MRTDEMRGLRSDAWSERSWVVSNAARRSVWICSARSHEASAVAANPEVHIYECARAATASATASWIAVDGDHQIEHSFRSRQAISGNREAYADDEVDHTEVLPVSVCQAGLQSCFGEI